MFRFDKFIDLLNEIGGQAIANFIEKRIDLKEYGRRSQELILVRKRLTRLKALIDIGGMRRIRRKVTN